MMTAQVLDEEHRLLQQSALVEQGMPSLAQTVGIATVRDVTAATFVVGRMLAGTCWQPAPFT